MATRMSSTTPTLNQLTTLPRVTAPGSSSSTARMSSAIEISSRLVFVTVTPATQRAVGGRHVTESLGHHDWRVGGWG